MKQKILDVHKILSFNPKFISLNYIKINFINYNIRKVINQYIFENFSEIRFNVKLNVIQLHILYYQN